MNLASTFRCPFLGAALVIAAVTASADILGKL
jgi:hypothetical protein